MSQTGFKFKFDWTHPFFDNYPNVGWNQERDGPQNKHVPSLVERKLENLGDKYFLFLHAGQRIAEMVETINKKFDLENNSLELTNEYRDLVLFTNYFFIEARSVLDLLAVVLHYLYKNQTPRSFSDYIKKDVHKLIKKEENFYAAIISARNTCWIKLLISINRSINQSIRDIIAHETIAKINIYSDSTGSQLIYLIHANRGTGAVGTANNSLDLLQTINEIIFGIAKILDAFKINYTQDRIRNILGIHK